MICDCCSSFYEDFVQNFFNNGKNYCKKCVVIIEKNIALREKCMKIGLKNDFLLWNCDKSKSNKTMSAVSNFVEKSMFLYGATATGKTRAFSVMCYFILQKKISTSICFYSIFELMLKINQLMNYKEALYDLINLVKNCDILIIDDFGKEKITEFTGATIFEILNYRYGRSDKRTWINSNFALNELEVKIGKDYGEYIVRRIREEYEGKVS